MTDQETKLQNAFVTTLSAEMGPTALTADVASIGNLTTPCYLVIEMESDTQREYILFDGTFGASAFVTTGSTPPQRYGAGSAAGSNLTHPIGSSVQSIATQQHFEDLNDRIDADAAVVAALDSTVASLDHGADLAGLAGDDHTQYHTDARGDARYSLIAASWFPVVFSFGIGEVEVGTEAAAFRWKAERACTLVGATPTAGTAPTGDSIDFDVSNDGTTMFSSKPTLAATSQDGTQATPSVTAIAAGDIIRGWVTQIGSTLPGENVALSLEIESP